MQHDPASWHTTADRQPEDLGDLRHTLGFHARLEGYVDVDAADAGRRTADDPAVGGVEE